MANLFHLARWPLLRRGDRRRSLAVGRDQMSKSEALQAPVHPGEILREDFMKPLNLTVNRLALELHVPATRIGEITHLSG